MVNSVLRDSGQVLSLQGTVISCAGHSVYMKLVLVYVTGINK